MVSHRVVHFRTSIWSLRVRHSMEASETSRKRGRKKGSVVKKKLAIVSALLFAGLVAALVLAYLEQLETEKEIERRLSGGDIDYYE
jgi:hypothetical protein